MVAALGKYLRTARPQQKRQPVRAVWRCPAAFGLDSGLVARRRRSCGTNYTGSAVVLHTVRNAKLDCICATPGNRAKCWRWIRAKSSVFSATIFSR